MKNWLLAPWYAMQRRIDIKVLWPALKQEAERRGHDLDMARDAFAYHAAGEPCWLALGEAECVRRIELLG